jgi:hypothetical protein
MADNATNSDVFVYTGEGGTAVPQDVIHLRVDPSVTSIPAYAFYPWQVPTKRRFERAVLLFKLDEICAKIKGNLVVL